MGRLGAARPPIVGCATKGAEIIAGSVTLNGASSPTAATHVGQGFTVTRKGTGQLLVTLDCSYQQILYVDVSLRQATAGNDVAFVLNASNPPSTGTLRAAATFEVETQSVAGTAGDLTGLVLGLFVIATKLPKNT